MEEQLVLKFKLEDRGRPTADAVAAALGDTVTGVRRDGGVYEVSFRPTTENEADALWIMLCEIGANYPGAVLTE